MNRIAARTYLRQRLDDNRGKQLWADDELDSYIDEAMDEAALRAEILEATVTLPLLAGVAEYALPQMVAFHWVMLAGGTRTLEEKAEVDLDRTRPGWRSTPDSVPTTILPADGRITFYPAPAANTTATVRIARMPVAGDEDDELDLPAKHQRRALDWAIHLAYDKRDADATDANKAERYKTRFEESFGERLDAQAMRMRSDRRTHRSKINPHWPTR